MSTATMTYQDICQQIEELPQASLVELAKFIEFLRFKMGESATETKAEKPLRIIKLGGLLKGYDFSPEFIAEARREMWGNFPRDIEFDATVEET